MVTARLALVPTVLLGVAWLSPPAAHGHALLLSPAPRDQQDGYKDPPRAPPGTGAPCGIGPTATQPMTPLAAGSTITVTWRETVTHPGCFVVDFAQANDSNFVVLGSKSHANPPTPGTPRDWSLSVALPTAACTGCTLRLRQLMLNSDVADTACPPATIPSGASYYSCANVQLTTGAPTDAGPPPPDAGTDQGGGGGAGASDGGCSYAASTPRSALALAVAALALLRRRRKEKTP